MTTPGVCPVDGCEWPVPTEGPIPRASTAIGEGLLRRGWGNGEDIRIEAALKDHYTTHTADEYLNTIIRLASYMSEADLYRSAAHGMNHEDWWGINGYEPTEYEAGDRDGKIRCIGWLIDAAEEAERL